MRIDGVELHTIQVYPDLRGHLAEVYRTDWAETFPAQQFHILHSEARSIRGVHVHLRHHDWKVVLLGRTTLAMKDLRRGSPTEGAVELLEMDSADPVAIHIPPRVAHGQLAHDLSITLVGSSHLYDPADDLGCRWDDPELGIVWPFEPELVSERDTNAQSLRELLEQMESWQPI